MYAFERIAEQHVPLFKSRADALFRVGASAHAVAAELRISHPDAVELGRQYAEEVRSGAADHRLALRAMIRAQLPGALGVAIEVMQAGRAALLGTGGKPGVSWSKDKAATARATLEAAKVIMALGRDVIGDDLVNAFTERPRQIVQPTIFDYAAEIQHDGSTVLSATPRAPGLTVIQGGRAPDTIDVPATPATPVDPLTLF